MGTVTVITKEQAEAAAALVASVSAQLDAMNKPTAKTAPKAAVTHDYKAIANGYEWGPGVHHDSLLSYTASLQARGFSDEEIREAAEWVRLEKMTGDYP